MSKKLIVDIEKKKYNDFPRVHALDNVKFEVEEGEFVCILGPNGCGKTTLLKLISGIDNDFIGKIVIGDRIVKNPDKDCGIVFQEPRLLPWINVIGNIKFGMYSKNTEKVDRLLNLLNLTKFSDSYPIKLSGGMAQKVALARALVNVPDVLLLDEPFASLDKLTKIKMQKELKNIIKKENTTVLMVTHDIEEAIYLSDRILIMSKRPGKIVKNYKISGEKEELISKINSDLFINQKT